MYVISKKLSVGCYLNSSELQIISGGQKLLQKLLRQNKTTYRKSMFTKLISTLVLASASLYALAENRIVLEQDVTKFSSKYWSSERIPADSDVVKVKKRIK